MDTNSCIIRGGTVVCADRVLPDCDVVVIDGRIAAIEPVGASDFDAQPDATMGVLPVVDARGAYVVPGLIDIHSDYVENVASPRPSVVMDLSTSLYKADRELVSHGVTTIFHSLSVYGAHVFDHKPIRDFGNVSALIDRVAVLRAGEERERYRALRDEQQEASLSLANKNRELMAAQDYEVRLATLSERSRIAREIHDNVGHLLTRSVLQVEALQVVHADDECVRGGLASVGATLHEAMDTVRKSVHDLHDDAFDLRARLEGVIGACGLDDVRLVYDVQDVPLPVAYGVVAVVREALSNVAKHSDATRVDVSVIEYPALYQLIVQDNGSRDGARSTAVDVPTAQAGIGLQTMEERVSSLGGRLRTGYRKGFRVFATVPKEPSKEKS